MPRKKPDLRPQVARVLAAAVQAPWRGLVWRSPDGQVVRVYAQGPEASGAYAEVSRADHIILYGEGLPGFSALMTALRDPRLRDAGVERSATMPSALPPGVSPPPPQAPAPPAPQRPLRHAPSPMPELAILPASPSRQPRAARGPSKASLQRRVGSSEAWSDAELLKLGPALDAQNLDSWPPGLRYQTEEVLAWWRTLRLSED